MLENPPLDVPVGQMVVGHSRAVERAMLPVDIAAGVFDKAPEPPAVNLTFDALMTTLARSDDELSAEINWEQLLGDIRDKVDAIDHVLKVLKYRQKFWSDLAKPMAKRAKSANDNYERLREYVAAVMAREKFLSVPGNAVRFQLYDSEPSLNITRPEATAVDYQAHPGLVEPVRGYRWNSAAIKAALEAGTLGKDGVCEFAKLERSQFVKPHPVKPELPPKKARGKKQ